MFLRETYIIKEVIIQLCMCGGHGWDRRQKAKGKGQKAKVSRYCRRNETPWQQKEN